MLLTNTHQWRQQQQQHQQQCHWRIPMLGLLFWLRTTASCCCEAFVVSHTTTLCGRTLSSSSLVVKRKERVDAVDYSAASSTFVTHNKDDCSIDHLDRKTESSNKIVIIDVENLRGQAGFLYTHKDLLEALTTWTQTRHLYGRVTLIVDHGTTDQYWLPDKGVAIVFAGSIAKADDVIVHETLPYFLTSFRNAVDQGQSLNGNRSEGNNKSKHHDDGRRPHIILVTADHGLVRRCRHHADKRKLSILTPLKLLEELDHLRSSSSSGSNDSPIDANYLTDKLSQCESLLRLKRGAITQKQRKRLKLKVRELQKVIAITKEHGNTACNRSGPSVLSLWSKLQRSFFTRKETTDDRIVLADRWQNELLEEYGWSMNALESQAASCLREDNDNDDQSVMPQRLLPVVSYVEQARQKTLDSSYPNPSSIVKSDLVSSTALRMAGNDMMLDETLHLTEASSAVSSLRIVVISDTHGWEEQLGEKLSDGDILLHLGDFAYDEEHDYPDRLLQWQHLEKFDAWLAQQSHRHKIVLRGNHDPRRVKFHKSGAVFVEQITTLEIDQYSFVLIPFTRGIVTSSSVPKACHVVASHVPPKGLLDWVHPTGKRAGSHTLRRRVESMKGGPPAVWFCGHIHEGRGALHHWFCGTDREATLVVNAANADAGRATCLPHGPAVVEITRPSRTSRQRIAELVAMPGRYTHMNLLANNFFGKLHCCDSQMLLMAVDLGLRTGISLFSSTGRLLRYDNFNFESTEDLYNAAVEMLDSWHGEALSARVTHVAIEGGDPPLRQAWVNAMKGRQIALLEVKPDEWRDDLLSAKEKFNGEGAKAASRLIARQILSDYGMSAMQQDDNIQTDAAESILIGLHVARRLGWIVREPAIRRSQNGKVAAPLTACMVY